MILQKGVLTFLSLVQNGFDFALSDFGGADSPQTMHFGRVDPLQKPAEHDVRAHSIVLSRVGRQEPVFRLDCTPPVTPVWYPCIYSSIYKRARSEALSAAIWWVWHVRVIHPLGGAKRATMCRGWRRRRETVSSRHGALEEMTAVDRHRWSVESKTAVDGHRWLVQRRTAVDGHRFFVKGKTAVDRHRWLVQRRTAVDGHRFFVKGKTAVRPGKAATCIVLPFLLCPLYALQAVHGGFMLELERCCLYHLWGTGDLGPRVIMPAALANHVTQRTPAVWIECLPHFLSVSRPLCLSFLFVSRPLCLCHVAECGRDRCARAGKRIGCAGVPG